MNLNNTVLKIASVLIAVVVWFIVATSEQQEVSFYVPVKFVKEPEGLKAFTDTNLLSVLVKGSKISMKSLSFNDIKIEIDTSNFKSGDYLYRIKPNDITLPSGISLVRVEPQDIRFIVDKVGKKTVKVLPSFLGELKSGFKIVGVSITPSYVTAFGTSKKIKNIDSVETLPINITDIDKSIKMNIGVKWNEIITNTNPSEVTVEVRVAENIVEKQISDFDVVVKGVKDKFTDKLILENKKVSFTIKGRSDRVENIEKVKVYVDASKIDRVGRYELPVLVETGNDIEVYNIKPSKVMVEVKR
ncbi:MAG: hypothetical protein LDL13_02575 [Calditerrivibrio sp.]|nr:hypothetical protein [Calditerrivibrio sp.]MCA1981091.1 hypothetical protein [Calditerrivibrio sp.]